MNDLNSVYLVGRVRKVNSGEDKNWVQVTSNSYAYWKGQYVCQRLVSLVWIDDNVVDILNDNERVGVNGCLVNHGIETRIKASAIQRLEMFAEDGTDINKEDIPEGSMIGITEKR